MSRIAVYSLCVLLFNACIYIPYNTYNNHSDLTDTVLELIVEGATSDRTLMSNDGNDDIPTAPANTVDPLKNLIAGYHSTLLFNNPFSWVGKRAIADIAQVLPSRSISVLSPPPDKG